MATFTITSMADRANDTSTSTLRANETASGTLPEAITFANLNASELITTTTTACGTVAMAGDLTLMVNSSECEGSGDTMTLQPIDGSNQFHGLLISGIAADGHDAAAITDAVKLAGAGATSAVKYSDITHDASPETTRISGLRR